MERWLATTANLFIHNSYNVYHSEVTEYALGIIYFVSAFKYGFKYLI